MLVGIPGVRRAPSIFWDSLEVDGAPWLAARRMGRPPSISVTSTVGSTPIDDAGDVLVDVDALRRLRGAIHDGPDGPYVWGEFERLLTDCHVVRALGRGDVDVVHGHLRAVSNRLTDLRTCAMKLAWMLERRDAGELDPFAWMFFASSDVNSFLTNVRSLFDHLARVLRAVASAPAGVPAFSFNDLRKWTQSQDLGRARQLGHRAFELVVKCDWFDELRDLRDELVHQDAQTLVFPEHPTIAVQVYAGARHLLQEPALMLSENVASFERLASATMARLHLLLEHTAAAVRDALALDQPVGDGQSVHGGLGVLARWTDDYLTQLS